ncbi:MAG: glycosyltransferase family A protein [Acidobacteriota bacterium]
MNRARRFELWVEKRNTTKRPLIGADFHGVSRAVVIPVLAESETLFQTLRSLAENPAEELKDTLVVCVVNNRAEPYARADQIADNQKALKQLEEIAQGHALRLAYIDASSPGKELGPKMGVGEARRIGLDSALGVLCLNEKPEGLLISLDADTLVEPGYLRAIGEHFASCDAGAGVVAYHHPIPEEPERRVAMILYELFLRYHELGLRSAGSPYAWPTVGSTIVVRGDAYVAAGGMNRKQAGEDFYFIQQLVKTSTVSRIDSTIVCPSNRASDRVPFGTGAGIGRHLAGDDGLFRVYHPEGYRVLGAWLDLVCESLDASAEALLEGAGAINPELECFLNQRGFAEIWPGLKQNAPDLAGLEAQFHRWFDAFKSLKLMHHLRDHGYPPMAIEEAVADLLPSIGAEVDCCVDSDRLFHLLDQLRVTCREWD